GVRRGVYPKELRNRGKRRTAVSSIGSEGLIVDVSPNSECSPAVHEVAPQGAVFLDWGVEENRSRRISPHRLHESCRRIYVCDRQIHKVADGSKPGHATLPPVIFYVTDVVSDQERRHDLLVFAWDETPLGRVCENWVGVTGRDINPRNHPIGVDVVEHETHAVRESRRI